ncbi:MAG: hypothetical protein ACD_8C00096G0003 [uncultured bacterium]|nr:MAG: hypothetical protein ACD_8C00096G0003 [uncultured bacterium]
MNLINIAHAGIITDAPSVSDIGMKFFNFLLSVVGIFAIIALVLAGIFYFISSGDTQKAELAKRIMKYAVIGIAVAMGAMIAIKFTGQFFG